MRHIAAVFVGAVLIAGGPGSALGQEAPPSAELEVPAELVKAGFPNRIPPRPPDLDPAAPLAIDVLPDKDDKSGSKVKVAWFPPERVPEGLKLVGYRFHESADGGPFKAPLDQPLAGPDAALTVQPFSGHWSWKSYYVRVAALYVPEGTPEKNWGVEGQKRPKDLEGEWVIAQDVLSPPVGPVTTRSVAQWFDREKINILVTALLYCAAVLWFLARARRGREMYLRPIPGIQAVDDAIGRATEMGKPILYVSGLGGIGSVSTIASMIVLGRVARRTAEYDTPLLVPCNDPLVMAAEREIVREAYLAVGKPDAYDPDSIFFVTDSQFGYVAAVDGMMMREEPAANFYMGYFYAESLILAETGAASGAIQIAGTDADTQIPFFVTACDYTLMGEELYAASAYLAREPVLLAQLKAQDVGKVAIGAAVFLGAAAATLLAFVAEGGAWARHVEQFLKLFAT